MHDAYYMLHTTYYILVYPQYILHVAYILVYAQYILHVTHYILHIGISTVHITYYILHIGICIMHTTCYILHVTYYIPYAKKHWRQKTLANKDCRKFGEKNFGELKSMPVYNRYSRLYIFNRIDLIVQRTEWRWPAQ